MCNYYRYVMSIQNLCCFYVRDHPFNLNGGGGGGGGGGAME